MKDIIYDDNLFYTKPRDSFADMLSCAFAARPKSTRAFEALRNIKLAFYKTGVGLTDAELAWLQRLAKRGGWRKPKRGRCHAR